MSRIKFYLAAILFFHLSYAQSKEWDDIAKTTAANLKGHELLYDEGFYIISSTESAISYFKENTLQTSAAAWAQVIAELKKGTHRYYQDVKDNPQVFKETYSSLENFRKEFQSWVENEQHSLIQEELNFSRKQFSRSYQKFLQGTLLIRKRTEKQREEILHIGKDYFANLKSDFSNMGKLISSLKSKVRLRSAKKDQGKPITWSGSLEQASQEFDKEYRASGEKKNSLEAIPHIIWGHMKALYYGIFAPSGRSLQMGLSQVGELTLKGIEKFIFLPVASTVLVGGRTIYSIAGVVYYGTEMGIHILSSHVEAGLHSAVAMIGAASVVPTYVGGEVLGVASFIGLKGASALGATTTVGVETSYESAEYLGEIFYNVGKGAGKALVGSTKSAVVLGYNAISSLPAHLVMGAVDATFFLVYDGPRLSLAWIKGDLDKRAPDLPVGAVVDPVRLEKESGLKMSPLTHEGEVIDKVIKSSVFDLRER